MARPTRGDLMWIVLFTVAGYFVAIFLGAGDGGAIGAAILVFLTRLAYASYARGTFGRPRR